MSREQPSPEELAMYRSIQAKLSAGDEEVEDFQLLVSAMLARTGARGVIDLIVDHPDVAALLADDLGDLGEEPPDQHSLTPLWRQAADFEDDL